MRKRGITNTQALKARRNQLRHSLTPAEAVLWKCLQHRQVGGFKFRRQASIGPFVVDFFCPERRVAVELDGAPHFWVGVEEYQARRTRFLEERGVRIVRFENKVVFENLEGVLEIIRLECESIED